MITANFTPAMQFVFNRVSDITLAMSFEGLENEIKAVNSLRPTLTSKVEAALLISVEFAKQTIDENLTGILYYDGIDITPYL